MSMQNFLNDLKMVESASASNTIEPFAAHELLPLISSLAKEVARIEGGLVQVANSKAELQPQMTQVSVQFITELRIFLKELAFDGILLLTQGEEEDEQNIRARGLFLALESQIERKPLEMVANFWMKQMEAQAEQMLAEMESEEEEEEENVELVEEDSRHFQQPLPTPSELPQPPSPLVPTPMAVNSGQSTGVEGRSDDDQTG